MSERIKGYIACALILMALAGLVYLNVHHSRPLYDFNPRADENSEGQCP
jgi:hypothetical protein